MVFEELVNCLSAKSHGSTISLIMKTASKSPGSSKGAVIMELLFFFVVFEGVGKKYATHTRAIMSSDDS